MISNKHYIIDIQELKIGNICDRIGVKIKIEIDVMGNRQYSHKKCGLMYFIIKW